MSTSYPICVSSRPSFRDNAFEAGGAVEDLLLASENAPATDRGSLDASASGEAGILGRTLRLDGGNAERGGR